MSGVSVTSRGVRDGLRRDPVRTLMMVLAVAALLVGGYGFWQAHQIGSAPARQNQALVDMSATSEVQSVVSQGLTRVLSYDFDQPGRTQEAAAQVLAGPAREQYDTLFATLKEKAPGQQLVLSAQVQSVAVKELDDDSASVLVFLDQASQRASDDASSVSAAQLGVDLEKSAGEWKITGLEPR